MPLNRVEELFNSAHNLNMNIIIPVLLFMGSASILYGICSTVLTLGKLKKDRNNVESIEYLFKNPGELKVLKKPGLFVLVGFSLFLLLKLIQRMGFQ